MSSSSFDNGKRRPFISSTPATSPAPSPSKRFLTMPASPPLPHIPFRTSTPLVASLLRTRAPYLITIAILLSLLVFPSLHRSTTSSSSTLSFSSSSSEETKESYRAMLERKTSAPWMIDLWPTLTFDHIYVLNLPNRKDRREQMDLLAKALGLRLTYVEAVHKEEEGLMWVAERVKEVRERKAKLMAAARKVPVSSIGGLKVGSDWLSTSQDLSNSRPFPPLPFSSSSKKTWIDILEATPVTSLEPSNPALNISEYLNDPLDKASGRQVNEGVLSTYYGHIQALKMVVENKDRSALILEDDVDLEWDLHRLWGRIHAKLPFDWDIIFLGHCWGRELLKPAYLHPYLHLSTSPMCLHAYGVTLSGARHLLSHLLSPWTAYQTPIDTAIPTLIQNNKLVSFSVEPPLIIQRKDSPSDIHKGQGSRWRGLLRDSTWERILRGDGKVVPEEDWEISQKDPANIFRYKTPQCD